MLQKEAVHILQSLVDGIDPHSRQEIPLNNPIRHFMTVRALRLALNALQGAPVIENLRLDFPAVDENTQASLPPLQEKREPPAKAGQAWTREEDDELIDQFKKGLTMREIARKHERTRGAIKSRLHRLGLIFEHGG